MNNPICPNCKSSIPPDAPGGICPSCALLGAAAPTRVVTAAGAPALDEVRVAFPELEVIEVIGQGGMGVVFKALQPKLDRLIALKILPPALASQPGFIERFEREARALAKLNHPHIVGVFDFGERAGFCYLAMEFVDGVNLRAAMRAGVTPEQALALVPRVCEALQFAHDHGILHRDIKPENILLDTRGVPKLADFGIAKLSGDPTSSGLTLSGAQLGTAAYMAPEQVEKPATVDHRADIYSLGVVLYEMLTGELPLGRFAAPSEKSKVGSGVDDVVLRALEKERERRQQSATEMKSEVEHATAARSAAAAPDAEAAGADGPLSRTLLVLTALSGIGIPISGMMHWRTPSPVHMVATVILFGTLLGLVRGFTRQRVATPAGVGGVPVNPWPRRIFWLIILIFVVPTVLFVAALVVPYLALQRGGPSGVMHPVSAFLDVDYSKSDPINHGLQKLTLRSHTPYGWVTDFSLRIRDEKGEREMPFSSFIVAQQQPSNLGSAAELEAEVSWEFLVGDGKNAGYQYQFRHEVSNRSKLPRNTQRSDGHISGATVENSANFRGLRWELHPSRADMRHLAIGESPTQIFFLRGLPPEAGVPSYGAEIFVMVKCRRMKPGEKAEQFAALLGEDRFERLAPAPQTNALQEEAIVLARQALAEAQKRVAAGTASPMDVANAQLQLATAEARGDAAKIAEARIRFLEEQLKTSRAQFEAGTLTADSVRQIEYQLNAAKQDLEKAKAAPAIER